MPKLGVEIFRCDEPNIQVPKYLQVGRRVSLVLALRSQNRDFDAGAVQLAGDDEAVATVVAAAADEESLPWEYRSRAILAMATPARSISTPPGMPRSCAAASARDISCAL